MLSSPSSDLGYFLCEQVSPNQATLSPASEWSVWQNESCTLASRASPSFDRGASDRRPSDGNSQSCTNLLDDKKRVKVRGLKAPSVAPCVPPSRIPRGLPLAFVQRSTEAADAALVAAANSRFSSHALSSAYSTPRAVFSTKESDRAPFIPTRALPLVPTPPRSRCLPVATDVLPIPPRSSLLKPVTANASAMGSSSPLLHPVSSSSSPLPYDTSSSPLSYHSFNIPLSDSPDSQPDYQQTYSPYDKPILEKDFEGLDGLELDYDIIDEFLIPDRQMVQYHYQFDASPLALQFDSAPVSPAFFSFIDEIIDEVRDEIHTEKSSPSPSDTLAESISMIAHSDIDAKLKIVTSSSCSDKAYKVTIEPVKKSRKRLAPAPLPSSYGPDGVKKERVDISKLSREEAAERKRYQNRVAAQRYRAKIRDERDSEYSECVFLEERNAVLREQEVLLEQEIAKYKALLLNRAASQ